MKEDDSKFEVSVDTHGYKPEDLQVRIKDNMVTIEAKNEEKKEETNSKENDNKVQNDNSSTTNVVNTSQCVLLQTAKASISNSDNNKLKSDARLLFDNCSQKSFVTKELVDKLRLKVIKREQLSVKTFGNDEEKVQTLDVVSFQVKNIKNSIKTSIEAFAVPTICLPISNQVINKAKEKYDVLNEIQLADSDDESADEGKELEQAFDVLEQTWGAVQGVDGAMLKCYQSM